MASQSLISTVDSYENYIEKNGKDEQVINAYVDACSVAINGEKDIEYGLQLTKRAKELIEGFCTAKTGGTIWDLDYYHFKLNALVKNHIVVLHKAELITVTGNSDREYSFSFSLPSDAEIIMQLPIIYAGGKGISIGRNVNKDFTVLLWNNNSSTQDVGVIYYGVYII